jgi:hypothetical protein
MLHMIVNTHNPESCAFRSDADQEALVSALQRLGEAAAAHDATVRGSWNNRSAHTFFMLLDAPDAHAVDEILRDAGLTARAHSTVYAVIEMETLFEQLGR